MKESTFFDRYKELILGVLMFAFGIFYLYHSAGIRTRSTVSVSAKLIPEILGMMILVLGVLQIIGGVRALRRIVLVNRANNIRHVVIDKVEKRHAVPVILTFIVILGYAMAFEWLGFVAASTLCMFCQMWVLSPKGKFKTAWFFLISLISAIVVYIAFRKGLNLSLPPGIMDFLPF